MQHPSNGFYMANPASTSLPSAPSSVDLSTAGSTSAYSPPNSVVHAHLTNNHSHGMLHAQPVMQTLPDSNVDETTIEDAYVSFILACNPAVSPNVDTTALREAFRTPPRSDGRSFHIYSLYLRIRELEDRIIKTWAELALRLGVEPPDQEKGQSSQKIQQYAVRLKRWMHSMHVNAFFDYLMGREHPYWVEIPSENYRVGELLRDGVAAKDDMALRALIPEIKPRRGRKRDDDADSEYMSRDQQRQRMDYSSDSWAGAQNAGGMYGYTSSQQLSPNDSVRSSPPWGTGSDGMASAASHGGFWGEEYRAPASSSPASSGRRAGRRHGAKVVSSAWRSGGAGGSGKTRGRPPINRSGNHHGHPAAPQDGSFPPVSVIERTTPPFPPQTTSTYLPHMESAASISPLPPSAMNIHPDLHAAIPSMGHIGSTSGILPPPIPQSAYSGATDPQLRGSARPGHLALQIPDRKGDVHIASAHMQDMQGNVMPGGPGMSMHVTGMPHAVNQTVNSVSLNNYDTSHLDMPPMNMSFVPAELQHSPHSHHLGGQNSPMAMHQMTTGAGTPSVASDAASSYTSDPIIDSTQLPSEGFKDPIKPLPLYQSRFGNGSPNDHTNIDELEAFFMTELFAASWYDENDNKITSRSIEETAALVEMVINNLTKAAASKEAFLINLAALSGGKILMANTILRVKRLERTAEATKYSCSWEYRYGDVRGSFSITEALPHANWKTLTDDVKAAVARAVGLSSDSSDPATPREAKNTQNTQPGPKPSSNSGQDHAASGVDGMKRAKVVVPVTIEKAGAAKVRPDIDFGLPKPSSDGLGGDADKSSGGGSGSAGGPSKSSAANLDKDNAALAALWEKKYRRLLQILHKRDQQLDRTRASVIKSLQNTYDEDEDIFDS